MEDKSTYDVRGYQSRIFRLFCFDKEGLLHMVFYRMAIFVAVLLAASMVLSAVYSGHSAPFISYSKVLFMLLWILFTPQLFETFKAISLISSRGIVFGRLNRSFMKYGVHKSRTYAVLGALPYAVLLIWALGFIGLVWLWFI